MKLNLLMTIFCISAFGAADTNGIKDEIRSLAERASSKVSSTTATDTQLLQVRDLLANAVALLDQSNVVVEPTDPYSQLKSILSLGAPNETTAKSLRVALALSLSDLSSGQQGGGALVRSILDFGLVPAEKKEKVQVALDLIEGFNEAPGVGFTICSKYNGPGNCASDGSLGYGLCSLFNYPGNCSSQGSVGYGVCSLFNYPGNCSSNGSAAYGLCSTKNYPGNCSSTSDLGYGLCSLNNYPGNCSSNGTLGYGICSLHNYPGNCAATASIGYGTCATTNYPGNCSSEGSAGYGMCSLHNYPGNCSPSGSIKYGVCSVTNYPGNCSN